MKLSLDKLQPTYKHGINRGNILFSYSKLLNNTFDYKLDFDVYLKSKGVNLQRPLCWTQIQKEQLILFMLKGGKLPVFVCVQHSVSRGVGRGKGEETTIFVLDGKQRLNTIFEFMSGEFPIPFEENWYYFNDLEDRAQRHIANEYPTWDIHYSYDDAPISDETMIQIFEQVNFLGTPQDVEHLNKLKSL